MRKKQRVRMAKKDCKRENRNSFNLAKNEVKKPEQ
jgi:hypothetical protein